jgi:hypothetical protein
VTIKTLVVFVLFVFVNVSGTGVAAAAGKEDVDFAVQRPAILPALYASLGAMQAWDFYSTRAALQAGAREANPAAAPFAGTAGSLLGLKAASTVSTIYLAERMWKKNKVGAVVMLVAINGATAAVSLRNMRNASTLNKLSTR